MNFNLHFGELHSDNSIKDQNNLFEKVIPKCYKVQRILISFNCFSEYSYTMGCPPIRGDNPRALMSGLSYVQVDKHGITILYHQHQ